MTLIAASGWEVTIPLIVAAIAAAAGVLTWFVTGVRAERARLQKLYADAFSAVVSYQEFPYVIRRRRAPLVDHEEIGNEERLRIATALHAVQEALNNYRAQIKAESLPVSGKYEILVRETRHIAGGYMHEAWKSPPLDNDAGMNVTRMDYDPLEEPEREYLHAVKEDMTFWRIAIPYLRS